MSDSTTNASQSRQARSRESKNSITTLTNRTIEVVADELRGALTRETKDILAIGELLLEAKAKVGHGKWLSWLKEEVSMSDRSAAKYMKAAEFAVKFELDSNLNVSPSALYLLSEDSYWENKRWRKEATDAVIKASRKDRVGSDHAKEIIDKTIAEKAKEKAREEALARAMSGDMEAAKRQALEGRNCWEDIESAWKRGWIDGNWGDERQAKFEAEWEEACARTRQPADGAEGTAPTNNQYSETTTATITSEQAAETEEDPTQGINRSSSEHTRQPPSVVERKDEKRRGRAAAADQDSRRKEGFDQLERLLEEIKQIVSAYDDHDRLMLRRGPLAPANDAAACPA